MSGSRPALLSASASASIGTRPRESAVKMRRATADTQAMMISEEQALAAAALLKTTGRASSSVDRVEISADLVAAAVAAASFTPDVDPCRLINAEAFLHDGLADSHEIASMMLKRLVSDALR